MDREYRADDPMVVPAVGLLMTVSDLGNIFGLPADKGAKLLAVNTTQANGGIMTEGLLGALKIVTTEADLILDARDEEIRRKHATPTAP